MATVAIVTVSTSLASAQSVSSTAVQTFERRGDDGLTRVRPYQVHLAADLSIVGASIVGWVVPQVLLPSIIVPECPCSSANVLPIDRFTAGRRVDSISFASDITLASLVLAAPLLDLLDVRTSRGQWAEWLEDLLVIGETVLISGAVNQLTKIGVRRPRPRLYDLPAGDPLLSEPDNYLSFYSAHSSTIFSTGIALGMTYWFRHPGSPVRGLPLLGAVAAGLGVASMRVLAGKHFLSDVFVGALLGSVVGVLVPSLHRRVPSAQLSVSPLRTADAVTGAHLAFSLRF
jgi:membrane-associated phospholipid phosphatase